MTLNPPPDWYGRRAAGPQLSKMFLAWAGAPRRDSRGSTQRMISPGARMGRIAPARAPRRAWPALGTLAFFLALGVAATWPIWSGR